MKTATLSTAAVLVSVFGVVAGALGDTATVPPCGQFDCSATVPTAPRGLGTIPVPEPANLLSFVADKEAAIRLGKAAFWDMQIGSDNQTACATCHFHAGADSRSINQLHPGADGKFYVGPNFHLEASHFPLRRLTDPTDRGSPASVDVNDVVSSQGVFNMEFDRMDKDAEKINRPFDSVFSVQGLNVRRVEPRNTPSVINAVFNHRNFWDGRAQNEFNGVNNWGDRDPNARVYRAITSGTPPEAVRLADHANLRLTNASLASQAVAPILSTTEMSAAGRDAMDIGGRFGGARGKKLAKLRPLTLQRVHPEDSVLGSLSAWPYRGLKNVDYPALIRAAFKREWWDSDYVLKVDDDGVVTAVIKKKDTDKLKDDEFTLMEYNFGLFFGLAVQLYQATLVANDTPYDRWREGNGTISQQAFEGLKVFLSVNKPLLDAQGNPVPNTGVNEGARCINCHAGPVFTDASVITVTTLNPAKPDEGSVRRKREGQELDRGFNNIGVRSTLEDLGVGGKDKFGKSLSATALCRERGGVGTPESPCPPTASTFVAVDGAFKVPGLRNVELTAPYFHNGGHLSLESVMDFYSRGGDFGCSKNLVTPCGATPGAQPIRAVNGTEIAPLGIPGFSSPTQGLTQADKDALVAFMKSLTDERVRYRKAPFDHPQLFVPHGQLNDHVTAVKDPDEKGQAQDRVRELPAVGKNGGDPLAGFLGYQ
jgi:cytochrome c peroxidase